MMHKRTKSCAISKMTKLIVYTRDNQRCIFCGRKGLPEAHVVPRSHGGLGVPQNIVTVCRKCHDLMDNSTQRQQLIEIAKAYLKDYYPDISQSDVIYQKWDKDKAKRLIKMAEPRNKVALQTLKDQLCEKDKEKPPQGFEWI